MSPEPIRWGVIGCGDVVRKRVARAILDDPHSQLIAACRRDEDALSAFCDSFAVERRYSLDQDLLADPDIDAVYIATPVDLHLHQTVEAASNGKHVLVEKPMALTVDECDRMIAACRANDVGLGVAFYRRFYPAVTRIKELISSGTLGRVLSAWAATSSRFQLGPCDDGYWRVVPSRGGGGSLMDIGSHRIELLQHLFGAIEGVKAFCDTVAADYEAEDCASLIVRFASGMHAHVQCLFGTEASLDRFSVVGTRGRADCSPLNGGELTVEIDGKTWVESLPPGANLSAPLIADFVVAIREGRAPSVGGEEGRMVNVVMQRAYQDARGQ